MIASMAEAPDKLSKYGRATRVLFVTARYPPFLGGTEIYSYEMARRMARDGFNVTVLTTNPHNALPALEMSDGVLIRRVNAWPRNGDYYIALGLRNIISQTAWDIMHLHGYHTFVAPIAMLSALRVGLPYVVTFHSGGHSSRLRTALRGPQRALLRPLLGRARKLIAVSQFEHDFFLRKLRLPADRFVIIPGGAQLPPGPDPMDCPPDNNLVVSVGRLERYKGHHRVIEALPLVLKHRPDMRLRIVGSGPYEHALRQIARQLGVADRVEIRAVEPTDRGGMAAVLSGAALVILLSDYESQALAVMEALKLRRPVLVAETTALAELAAQSFARATPPNSTPGQVAAAIVHELRHPVSPPDIDLPSWDACIADHIAIYESVLGVQLCVSS